MASSDQQEWARHRVTAKKDERQKNKQDPRIVAQIQKEAKANGASLANGGRGGLDPKLALTVFRRDKWRCQVPQCKTPKKNLDLDHIGGHPLEIRDAVKQGEKIDPQVVKAANMGHKNDAKDLHVICEAHHNAVHARERALEKGKKPKPIGPRGIADDRK